jgi:hypothetical protein
MKKIAAALILVSVAGLANAAKPQIQWNPDYDFAAVDGYAWTDSSGATLVNSDPFLHSRIQSALDFELTGYGLTETSAEPDVYVSYHLSTQTDVQVRAETVGYSFGRYGTGRWGHYGYGAVVPITTTADIVEIKRGTLVVDVWDIESNELVWRGTVPDIAISDNSVRTERNTLKAIDQMAKQYQKLRERANRQ